MDDEVALPTLVVTSNIATALTTISHYKQTNFNLIIMFQSHERPVERIKKSLLD